MDHIIYTYHGDRSLIGLYVFKLKQQHFKVSILQGTTVVIKHYTPIESKFEVSNQKAIPIWAEIKTAFGIFLFLQFLGQERTESQ